MELTLPPVAQPDPALAPADVPGSGVLERPSDGGSGPAIGALLAPVGGCAIARRLANFGDLGSEEIAALQRLSHNRKTFAAGETLVRQGSKPFAVFLILKGVAYRYKYLANGKRQIFGYLLTGDVCDAHFILSRQSDHDIGLLTQTEVAMVPMHELTAVLAEYPGIRDALSKMTLVEDAVLREWLLNVGQRSAPQKLAHFICEISERLLAVGSVNPDGSFDVPLTQSDVADTMGLTVVHVSRCLQKFRLEGLADWSRHQLTILDRPRLQRVAGFDAGYLHFRGPHAPSVDPAYV